MLRTTSPYRAAWAAMLGLCRAGQSLIARRQRQQVLQDSLLLMRFWAWYRCVPPHYLGAALRHNLAKLLTPKVQALQRRMPASEFVRVQRQRLTQLREPIAGSPLRAGRGAHAEFIAELQQLATHSPYNGQADLQKQLAGLAMRLRVDVLRHDAERARLLGHAQQARVALTAALTEVHEAGPWSANGAAAAEAQALRVQLAALPA